MMANAAPSHDPEVTERDGDAAPVKRTTSGAVSDAEYVANVDDALMGATGA